VTGHVGSYQASGGQWSDKASGERSRAKLSSAALVFWKQRLKPTMILKRRKTWTFFQEGA
jgi:hypothetical protein